MAQPQKDQPLTLTVSIDDEQADIDIDPSRRVHDLIRHALVAFDIDEKADRCHLAGAGRLYGPQQRVGDLDLESGATLSLRLPF